MDTIARAKIEHSLFPASSARPPTIPGSRDRQRFTHLVRIVPFSLIRGPACDGDAGRCFLRRTSTRNAKLDEAEENTWKNESQKEHPPFPRLPSRTPDVAIHVNVRRSLVNLPNGRWLYAAYDSDIYRYYIEMKEKKKRKKTNWFGNGGRMLVEPHQNDKITIVRRSSYYVAVFD